MEVRGLYHHPVKGLSAQALERVSLTPGEEFPFDRVYGLARHDSGHDPSSYQPLPKSRFIVLVKEDRLIGLSTFFDTDTKRLDIDVQEQRVLSDDLETAQGRDDVVRFFTDMFDLHEGSDPPAPLGDPRAPRRHLAVRLGRLGAAARGAAAHDRGAHGGQPMLAGAPGVQRGRLDAGGLDQQRLESVGLVSKRSSDPSLWAESRSPAGVGLRQPDTSGHDA